MTARQNLAVILILKEWKNLYLVGYQNITLNDQLTSAGFSWVISTLPTVGKAETDITLNDFQIVAPEGGLMGETSVNIHTYNEDGLETGNYSYVDEIAISMYYWMDENGELIQPGWYTTASLQGLTAYPEACGTSKIPFGDGFMVISDCGATITFSGQVSSKSTDIALNDQMTSAGFTWTGNCSPVDIKLQDISITPPAGGLMGETSVNIHTYNKDGLETGNYSYVDEIAISMYYWMDENGELIQPGWYTTASLQGLTAYPEACGNVTITSGEMFMVISDCGATMSIPSALPSAE